MTGPTAATIGLGALALTAIAIKSAVSWAKRRPVPAVADATLPDPRDADTSIGDIRHGSFTAINSSFYGYPTIDITLINVDTAQRDLVYVLARDAADASGSAVGIYVTGGGSEPVTWSYQEPDDNGRLRSLYVDLVYPQWTPR